MTITFTPADDNVDPIAQFCRIDATCDACGESMYLKVSDNCQEWAEDALRYFGWHLGRLTLCPSSKRLADMEQGK